MIARDRSQRRPNVVGLLDIGSFKVACLIVADTARAEGAVADRRLRVVGVGHQRSRGVKAGMIMNLDEAEASVRAAIAQAERMAGVTLEEVLVSVSCGRLRSRAFAASADVAGRVVGEEDIARVMSGGRAFAERDGRVLVHLNRVGFRLDGVCGHRDPRGMVARKLTADLHAVTADDAPVRNLLMVIERCYLGVAGLVPAGLASALAATTSEERRLGVTCIDLGAGATTMAVLVDGQFAFTDSIPMGGSHITYDIARALQTPLAEAERIKALYGASIVAHSDEHEVFSYPVPGMEDGVQARTSKSHLASIIRPRLESLLGQVRERLDSGGVAGLAHEHLVLTGGGSQMIGIADFAANVLGRSARVSRPGGISGLPPAMSGPAFSTVTGLLDAGRMAGSELAVYREREHLVQGYLGRVGEWLKQGF